MNLRSIMLSSVVVLCLGCQATEDPAVLAERAKYLLDVEPAGAVGVLEAREQFAQPQAAASEQAPPNETPAASRELVLVGRIGGGVNQTWEPGKAAFVVLDPSAEIPSHDHSAGGHSHDNCPFCQAAQKASEDASALIQLVDAQGEVVSIDARKLLPVRDGQLVVVKGQGQIDDLGNLVVAARGIYLRQ